MIRRLASHIQDLFARHARVRFICLGVFMKRSYLLLGVIIFLAFAAIVLRYFGFGITYQVSASMPKGFYLIMPSSLFYRGEAVVFKAPDYVRGELIHHHWIPDDGMMMKKITAMPGDDVCYQSNWLLLPHGKRLPIYHYYAPGKRLPRYYFCGQLPKNNYLLTSDRAKRSFDSRYFGPVSNRLILGKAIFL